MLRSMFCVLAILLIAASEPTMVEVRTGGVEVRTGGDDGLTQRLADQVRATFAATPGYTAHDSPKRLIIIIPTHVQWREIDGRTKITYRVEIASGSKSIRRSGSCWETDMPLCAHQVITAAAVFKRN